MPEIRLRPLTPEDSDGVRVLVEDAEARRYTRIPEPPPPGFEHTWIELYNPEIVGDTKAAFVITDDTGDAFYGLGMVPTIEAGSATAELGYLLTPAARGRGIATAALDALTRWAFEERRMYRIELLICVENAPSRAVAQRCGYSYEGTLRSIVLKDGPDGPIRHDTESWSKLATDPR